MHSSEKRPVIGLDLDDVLLSYNDGFLEYNRKHYGLDVKRADLKSFNYEEILPISREEAVRRGLEYCETEDHLNSPAIEGALESVEKLAENFDLFVVTSRPERMRHIVERWMNRMIPGLAAKVHFTDQYAGDQAKTRTKVQVCDELGIDVFVDDALHNAEPIAESGRKVFLFDCPWNQKAKLHPNITRVYSWKEIVEYLSEGKGRASPATI